MHSCSSSKAGWLSIRTSSGTARPARLPAGKHSLPASRCAWRRQRCTLEMLRALLQLLAVCPVALSLLLASFSVLHCFCLPFTLLPHLPPCWPPSILLAGGHRPLQPQRHAALALAGHCTSHAARRRPHPGAGSGAAGRAVHPASRGAGRPCHAARSSGQGGHPAVCGRVAATAA